MVNMSSPTKKKILLLLEAGVALGFTYSPKQQIRIIKNLANSWRFVDKKYLYRVVREFKHNRLVDYKEVPDGTIQIILSELGKKRILKYNLEEMKIKLPDKWDKKWRVVMFDIPEKKRKGRDALREKIKELGFYEMQKSVFIFPFECRDEIDFIVEFFQLRPYVRYAEATNLTNEAQLKIHFGLK